MIAETVARPELTFDEHRHAYHLDGKRVPSVTQILKPYFPFDRDKIARRVAGRRGVPVQDVLDEWEAARLTGSAEHAEIEAHLDGDPYADPHPAALDVLDRVEPLHWEERVASPTFRVAGTADLIARTPNGIALIDWKPRCDTRAFGSVRIGTHTIDRSRWSRYSMQLAIYRELVEEWMDIEVEHLVVVPLKEGSPRAVGELPKMREMARAVLEEAAVA